jgi:hypothetical protein
VALDFVSVLLAETLRSSTLKVALVAIGVFGCVMFALIGYVYWSTTSYVLSLSDRAIAAEQIILNEAYERSGRDGLVATIAQRMADGRLESGVYLLVDPSLVPVRGNLKSWPPALQGANGWVSVAQKLRPEAIDRALLRLTFTTLPDGSHLLVGRNIYDLDTFVCAISTLSTRPPELLCKAASANGCRSAVRETNGIDSPKT